MLVSQLLANAGEFSGSTRHMAQVNWRSLKVTLKKPKFWLVTLLPLSRTKGWYIFLCLNCHFRWFSLRALGLKRLVLTLAKWLDPRGLSGLKLFYTYHQQTHISFDPYLCLFFATDIMVSANPLFRGGITRRKLQATIISEIWPEVVFFSLVATSKYFVTVVFWLYGWLYCSIVVAVVSDGNIRHSHNLGISNVLLTVLGTVLGLVISFRTSSAYER